MIPKKIISIWIGEEMPEVVKKSLATHRQEGYEHIFIDDARLMDLMTFDHELSNSEYLEKCIKAKEWVRAVDYLRLWALKQYGGIYLDADAEIIGNFDNKLDSRMFAFTEASGYINNGYIGSEAGHPLLRYLMNTMEHSFRIDQNLFWAGMQFFAESYFIADRIGLDMKIYDEKDLKKIIKHHALNSWVKNEKDSSKN